MKRQWENEELVEHWTLDVEDRAFLDNKTGATRLLFAVLLKFFRREGRFPQHKNEVPALVITFLATQVGVDASAYMQYAWQGRTIEYGVTTFFPPKIPAKVPARSGTGLNEASSP